MSKGNTPRLLKANAIRSLGSKIVFDYHDLRRQCDDYVAKTRQQAQQMRDDATRDADEIRRRAHAEGHAAGRREGLTEAAQEIERQATELADQKALEKLQTTFPALQAAAAALVLERDRWLTHWETAAVRLGIAVAEKIVRREISLQPDIAVELVRETLELAAGSPRLQLKMHSGDIELLGQHAEETVSAASGCGEVEITADDSISRGGCVIETQHGTIDARLETQLERIMSELVADDEKTENGKRKTDISD